MKITTFVILFFISFCSAQKVYHFDYKIDYERNVLKKDITKKRISYLTNSKDNSYFAQISSYDSLNYQVNFSHHGGVYSNFLISKDEFDKTEFYNLTCNAIKPNINTLKRKANEYEFFILNDTLINQKKYSSYIIKSILKPRKRLKNQAGSILFIIDKTTNFHLPLLTRSITYEKWKTTRSLPSGIFIEKQFFDVNEKIVKMERLISYSEINKNITVPDNCDF